MHSKGLSIRKSGCAATTFFVKSVTNSPSSSRLSTTIASPKICLSAEKIRFGENGRQTKSSPKKGVIINKPTLNRHSNRHFYVSEKKSPKELLSPQIIFFFIEGSPVDNPTVLQNRGTMGVQIPSTFPKSLDFNKSTVSGQMIAYCCKSILTIPSENVHAAHVSPDRNYLAPDIGWKQPIPSLGESL